MDRRGAERTSADRWNRWTALRGHVRRSRSRGVDAAERARQRWCGRGGFPTGEREMAASRGDSCERWRSRRSLARRSRSRGVDAAERAGQRWRGRGAVPSSERETAASRSDSCERWRSRRSLARQSRSRGVDGAERARQRWCGRGAFPTGEREMAASRGDSCDHRRSRRSLARRSRPDAVDCPWRKEGRLRHGCVRARKYIHRSLRRLVGDPRRAKLRLLRFLPPRRAKLVWMDRDCGTSRRVGFPPNDVGHRRQEFRQLRRRLRLDEQLPQVRRVWRLENNRGVRVVTPRDHLLPRPLAPRLGLGLAPLRQGRDPGHDVSRRAVPGDVDLRQRETRRRRRHAAGRESRRQQKRVADERSRQLPAEAVRRGHPQPEERLGRVQSPHVARSPDNHPQVSKNIRRAPLPAHFETGWFKRTESVAGGSTHGDIRP